MSRLLLITALFTFALAAYADQLTIYQIESPANDDETPTMSLEGKSVTDLLAQLPEGAKITSEALLTTFSNEHFYLNNTYTMPYVVAQDAEGNPTQWTSRKVGILANAHLSRDDLLTINYENTSLSAWAPSQDTAKPPQPIFSTLAFNSDIYLPINQSMVMTGLKNGSKRNYTVIEHSSGNNPQPGQITVDQPIRHERYQISVYEMAFDGPSRNPDTGEIVPRNPDLVREQGKLIDFYELRTDNGVNYYFDNTRGVLGGGKNASGEPVLMESTIGARILLFAENDFASVTFSRRTLDRWRQIKGVDTPSPIINEESFQASVSLSPGEQTDEESIGGIEGTESHDGVASPYVSRIYYLKRIPGEPTDTRANPFGD
ncbi:hypothetical protein [Cerasicoccus fimbriatus]|uniref:hypothetical protein n=1 Tax=Cerasicoccus fimbriatus TaxID=3014554 RepID=UPI0022B308B7|nr:hypothetical protein [Cerasicoccus sp. TK19100]